jgi:hypothetical protein
MPSRLEYERARPVVAFSILAIVGSVSPSPASRLGSAADLDIFASSELASYL